MSRHQLRLAAAISITVGAFLVPSAPAVAVEGECTRYAARDGSDANPGTAAAPKLTVQGLVNSLGSGQTGCLRAGTYTEISNGYVARVSTPGVTLRSAPGERARIVGIVYVLDTAAGMRLSDLDIEGTGGSNTVKIYAPDVVVERNTITNAHRGQSCMMLGSNSGAGQATRIIVRRNHLSACGSPLNGNKDHAIYASNVEGGQIVENIIVDPTAYAIQLYPNARNTRFAHNVVDGGASIRGGVIFGGDTSFASINNTVEGNVLTHAATNGLTASWGGATGWGNVARSNCVFAAAGGAVGSTAGWVNETMVVADPRFVNRAAGDYRLATDSPCLNVVGYDTARLIAGETAPPPSPTPTPTPTTTPSPTPTPTPSPTPTPTTTPSPTPTPTTTPPPAPAPGNTAPAVTLTEPVAGQFATNLMRMSAAATDDGGVTKVEFYVNGRLVGTDPGAPYAITTSYAKRLKPGPHVATARAYDAAGLVTTSAPVTFQVGATVKLSRSAFTARGGRLKGSRARRAIR